MESFDQLLAGELDLAVRSREALPHGLRFEPLFASDRMLIVPRGHELAGKKRPTLRDLARDAFVIPPAGSRWRREARCPWAGDAGGYRRLIRNGRRDAVAGGGGKEGGVGGLSDLIEGGPAPSGGSAAFYPFFGACGRNILRISLTRFRSKRSGT